MSMFSSLRVCQNCPHPQLKCLPLLVSVSWAVLCSGHKYARIILMSGTILAVKGALDTVLVKELIQCHKCYPGVLYQWGVLPRRQAWWVVAPVKSGVEEVPWLSPQLLRHDLEGSLTSCSFQSLSVPFCLLLLSTEEGRPPWWQRWELHHQQAFSFQSCSLFWAAEKLTRMGALFVHLESCFSPHQPQGLKTAR